MKNKWNFRGKWVDKFWGIDFVYYGIIVVKTVNFVGKLVRVDDLLKTGDGGFLAHRFIDMWLFFFNITMIMTMMIILLIFCTGYFNDRRFISL